MTALSLALVPLDERPVNTQLVGDVVRIAGGDLALPPADALPRFRTPGDTAAIADWIAAAAGRHGRLIVSIDTLVHGGLIPARTTDTSTLDSLARLDVLRSLRAAHPDLHVAAVSLVTRASDSYSNVEEPDYWDRHGRDLHAWGGRVHAAWEDGTASSAAPDVPADVVADFAARRLRNHQVTLGALQLAWEGAIDDLVITADDTAPRSAGSAEQHLLDYWQRLAGSAVPVYPGADETGAILAARSLVGADDPVRVHVATADPGGLQRIPPYENAPLTTSIARQLTVAGARPVALDEAEVVIVVHTPDPDRGDQYAALAPGSDPDAAHACASLVETLLDDATPVAVADLRFANGADPLVVEALHDRGLLTSLAGYAGWNTAGNALGTAVATAVATVVGRRRRTLDRAAVRTALARRVLDDHSYQALVRREVAGELFGGSVPPVAPAQARAAERRLTALLGGEADRLGLGVAVERVTLPWDRAFEVCLNVA